MTHLTPPVASLGTAYASCRDLHRTHGRSYYLATRLLPAWKRRHVHALYGFTRYTDDIVDAGGDPPAPPRGTERARRLGQWVGQFYAAVDGAQAPADPILLAVRHTIATFGLPAGRNSAAISASSREVTGVVSLGLSTTVCPLLAAARTSQTAIIMGWFHGATGRSRQPAPGGSRTCSPACTRRATGPRAPARRPRKPDLVQHRRDLLRPGQRHQLARVATLGLGRYVLPRTRRR
jgi:Squalene/phytoene synthase